MPFKPGDISIEFARNNGWALTAKNIMVEGDRDVEYFSISSEQYWISHSKKLIGNNLSIFSSGKGDNGGTYGILRMFPSLCCVINTDLDENGKKLFRIITLLDDDKAGQSALATLKGRILQFIECRDIFLLKRIMPINSVLNPDGLKKQIDENNKLWKNLDCEIEDLLPDDFIEAFFEEFPRHKPRNIPHMNGMSHYSFSDDAKAELLRFTKKYAVYNDLKKFIEVIQALRSYLKLDPEGD